MRACVVMISMNQTTSTPASPAPPSSSGYADVNGLHLYYEDYDEQRTTTTKRPLVLLHGGMLNIELNFADLITRLAPRHRVIAVELQGHGRTADIERVISPANSASDVIALLDHLGIDHAHVLGHSMGGAVAMELAVSTADDMAAMRSSYERLSPHPEHFDDFLATLSASQEDLKGWSDEQLSAVRVPVLFIIGDHDFTTIEHAGLMVAKTPGSQLLVLPDTTHMQATHRVDVLDPALAAFLN